MAVIPKLTINPQALHTARRKLQSKQAGELTFFSGKEREALLALIQRGKRQIYPGPRQTDRYQYLLAQITETDPALEPAKFNNFAEKIEAFEQQWCK